LEHDVAGAVKGKVTEFRIIDRTEFPYCNKEGYFASEQNGQVLYYIDLGELPRDEYDHMHELVKRAMDRGIRQ
jgi:hypothetical protein